ncbi:MAG: LicD family protein [Cetobacterium sp.]
MVYLDGLKKRENYRNNLEGLKFVALEILKQFDYVCRKNGIDYWITDGTLLGAIRHGGFIPWDDDIDVCVNKNDMSKLERILDNELPYYLYFTNEDVNKGKKLAYYKIRDKYSKALELKNEDRQTGIWIDIFPMTFIKEDRVINYILKKIPDKNNLSDKKIKKILRKLIYKLLNIFGYKERSDIIQKYFKKLSRLEEKKSLIYMEGQEWWHTYKEEWIYPLKEIEFEGYKFLAPNKPEKYLKSYYGKNYMELPPENKRLTHCIEIDLFNSNNHPESLKWSDREDHIKKYLSESEENEI